MEKKEQYFELKPRKLGDEWEEWNGKFEENLGDMQTPPTLFLLLMYGVNVVFIIALSFFYFLLKNNLFKFNHFLSVIFNLLTISLIIAAVVYPVLFTLTLIFNKPIAFFIKDKQFADLNLIKAAIFLGQKLLIPKDKIINSMLKINNTLIDIFFGKIKKDELLILAPRCLAKSVREELKEIVDIYNIKLYIASGGNEARQILKENKPRGIIAIACERDLYAGVKEVPSEIPVIAISNKRPEGPCRNTLINTDDFKNAINFFLK